VGGTYPKEKGEKALLADPKDRAEDFTRVRSVYSTRVAI
jgi:hypothetical protein